MKKEISTEIEEYASRILHSYFCESDVEFLISTFAPDIVWLGAGLNQKAEGKDKVAACFREGRADLAPCHMYDEHYIVRELGNNCYLCQGDSWIKPKDNTGMYFQTHQRITFIFERTEDKLQTVHIHNSVDYSDIQEDELFPAQAGKKAYEQLRETLNRTEEKLVRYSSEAERQNRFLNQLYNTIPCGILQFTADMEHRIVNINRMVWEFYGFESEEEYLGEISSPFQLVLEKDREEIEKLVDNLVPGGGTITYTRESRRRDGTSVWINAVMGKVVNADGLEVIQALFTDATEVHALLKAQEQERIIENQSLRAATCIAYPMILSINLTRDEYNCFIEEQKSYIDKSRGIYTELAESMGNLVLPSFQEDFNRLFSREDILKKFGSGEREIYMEMKAKTVKGEEHWIAVHMIYVDNPVDEDVIAIELVQVLDSQRAEKAHQEQLLRDALSDAKAANKAKSDFLSRMSHDIRTPMNAIIGMSAIGQLKIDDPLCVKDCFEKIDTSSAYLLALINDILDMAKIENGKMEITPKPFSVTELVGDILSIIQPQAEQQGIGFKVRYNAGSEEYYCGDSLRLKQIIMNLLSNALKFTPEGGEVLLEVKKGAEEDGKTILTFRVMDTGIGISEEFMNRLFQPFEQESAEVARNNVGSGLGLSIVHNLVSLMNGTIQVESRKGEGTAFTAALPFKRDAVKNERNVHDTFKEADMKKLHFSGQKILLAEDNELNREIAKELLEAYGLIVDEAENGKIAAERFATASVQEYYAILMDIRMPVMDGLEATRAIRHIEKGRERKVPILAMTANAFEEDKTRAYEAGMSGYMVKPLQIQELLRELKKAGES